MEYLCTSVTFELVTTVYCQQNFMLVDYSIFDHMFHKGHFTLNPYSPVSIGYSFKMKFMDPFSKRLTVQVMFIIGICLYIISFIVLAFLIHHEFWYGDLRNEELVQEDSTKI